MMTEDDKKADATAFKAWNELVTSLNIEGHPTSEQAKSIQLSILVLIMLFIQSAPPNRRRDCFYNFLANLITRREVMINFQIPQQQPIQNQTETPQQSEDSS